MGEFTGIDWVLKHLRQSRGIGQLELSRTSGIARGLIIGYEAGRIVPTLESLGAVLGGLGVSRYEFLNALQEIQGKALFELIPFSEAPQSEAEELAAAFELQASPDAKQAFEGMVRPLRTWYLNRHSAQQSTAEPGLPPEVEQYLERSRELAKPLVKELLDLSFEEGSERLQEVDESHLFGVGEALSRASWETSLRDGKRSLELAQLASLAAQRVRPLEVRRELLLLTEACKGNALRALERFGEVQEAFDRIEEQRIRSSDFLRYHTRLLSLRMTLEIEMHEYPRAMATARLAIQVEKASAEPRKGIIATFLVKMGVAEIHEHNYESALLLAREAIQWNDLEAEPLVGVGARHGEVQALIALGRYSEAEVLLPILDQLMRDYNVPGTHKHVLWSKASLLVGLGRFEQAAEVLQEVRSFFLDAGLVAWAAVASLELATVYFSLGHISRVRELALESLSVLQAKGVSRESLAALTLLHQAALSETLTEKLLIDLTAYFRKAEHNPDLKFEPS